MVTHPVGSGFLYFEDTISYKLLWSKEFYASMGQAISIVECIIDNVNDFVFAATSKPASVFKLKGINGTIVYKKAILLAGSVPTTITLHSMIYYSPWIVVYYSDSSN